MKLLLFLSLLSTFSYAQTRPSSFFSKDSGGGDSDVIEFLDIAKDICSVANELNWSNEIDYKKCSNYISANIALLERNEPRITFTSNDLDVMENNETPKEAIFNRKTGKVTVLKPVWEKMSKKEKYTLVGIELSAMLGFSQRYSFGLKITNNWEKFINDFEVNDKPKKEYIQYLYHGFVHKETGLPIALESNANGVCKYLGYDRGLEMSKEVKYENYVTPVKFRSVVLDINGGQVEEKETEILGRVTCITSDSELYSSDERAWINY